MKTSRRSIFKGFACLAGTSLPVARAFGQQQCEPSQLGPVCSSYIPIQKLGKVYALKQCRNGVGLPQSR
jgi:hypothetical protein